MARRWPRWQRCFLMALSLSLLHWRSLAAADTMRVALIDPGAELERATRAALEPWHVEIIVISAPSPGPSAPALHSQAHALALREQVATVVWISAHEAGFALWAYDLAAREAVARPLSVQPPFDSPDAAAVALSLKTLLRHSESAPAEERYGAIEKPPAAEPAKTISPTAEPAPAPASSSSDHERAHKGPSRVEPDAWLDARFRFVTNGPVELRVGLAVSFWPRGSWGGFALRAAFGPSMEVSQQRFQGSFSSVTLGVAGRFRWEPVRWLRVAGGLLVLADLTRLDGVALREGQRIETSRRAVPSLALEGGVDWLALPWLRVGLRGSPAWLLRTQRYWVRDEPVLQLSRIAYQLALVLGFGYHDP